MIKLKQLQETLEEEILKLKEAWAAFEKERDLPKPDYDSIATSNHVTNIVKLILEVVSASNDTLSAYSHYTAALEKKYILEPKKNDSKRKKKSLSNPTIILFHKNGL